MGGGSITFRLKYLTICLIDILSNRTFHLNFVENCLKNLVYKCVNFFHLNLGNDKERLVEGLTLFVIDRKFLWFQS